MADLSNIPQTLAFKSAQQADMAQMLREAAIKLGQPALRAVVTSTKSGGVWTHSIQVVNSSGKPCAGYYLVEAFVATSPGGDPQGSQTADWPTGNVLATMLVNGWWTVLTGQDGTASLTLTGYTGSRYVHAIATGVADVSKETALP